MAERTRVLITVMTYPHPSRKYDEVICTGGITEQGEWVRLYPIDYRYRPRGQQFRKYQWIDVELEARGAGNDNRIESRRPIADTIAILGPPLPAGEWAERRAAMAKVSVHTVRELEALHERNGTSLGLVKPDEVLDLTVEEDDREWKPQWQAVLDQLNLFHRPKVLSKIPYKFRYLFRCRDDAEPRKAMIEDWELGVLFLNELERKGSEREAVESVRANFLGKACHPKRDTHFFMGTVFPYNKWIVGGVYYPPKITQPGFGF